MAEVLTYEIREIICPDQQLAMVACVRGNIDGSTLSTFESMFDEILAKKKCYRLIIDCGELKYINSTGLGIIVQYCDTLTENAGSFAMMNVSPKVMIILEMFGLQEFFPIVGTEEQAVAALTGGTKVAATVTAQLGDATPVVTSSVFTVGQHSCGNCGEDLIFTVSGYYLCPRCQALIDYDANRHVTATVASHDLATLELNIPAEQGFFKSAAALVARQGLRGGLTAAAAQEIVDNMPTVFATIKTVCADTSNSDLNLKILAFVTGKKLFAYIYCVGKRPNDGAFVELKTGFDQLTVGSVNSGALVLLQKNIV